MRAQKLLVFHRTIFDKRNVIIHRSFLMTFLRSHLRGLGIGILLALCAHGSPAAQMVWTNKSDRTGY
ncbi:MAG: hypothetical protein HUU04_06715 [Verrucomicrobiae bacterium]|nr:hypothetical protein [Verrucomicrobiae bacterium]